MRVLRLDDEGDNQEMLFQWVRLQQGRYPELGLLYHVPNGGKRDKLTAVTLKRQGVRAGIPDLVLPVARAGFHSLYIELKVGKNKTSKDQDRILESLEQQGNYTAICYGWEPARDVILHYLNGEAAKLGAPGAIWKYERKPVQGIEDLL